MKKNRGQGAATIVKKVFLTFIALGFLTAFPVVANHYEKYNLVHTAGIIGIYGILALGLNIVIGYTGLLDLGFIAFYGIGAYTGALLNIRGVSFWMSVPVCMVVCVIFRMLLGAPILRLRGDYLAIVTLGFGEITRIVLNNWDWLTNGPKGLPRVEEMMSPPKFFGLELVDDIHFYYLILAALFFLLLFSLHLYHSHVGRAWISIREDELAAELMGVNVPRYKLLAFAVSSVFASVAGCIYANWIAFVSPESFTFWESVLLVTVVVMGGIGNVWGVLLGVFLIQGVPEVLRDMLGSQFVDYRMLLFGILMTAFVIFRPKGLLPEKR